MTPLEKAAATLAQINDQAIRAASHDAAVQRGMARTEAMRSGPGTWKALPPAPATITPIAPPAAPAPPELPAGWGRARASGWDANRPSSMASLDAARRQREGH